ncbi:Na+/H+ antiporter [Knoellia sp. CPCC 206435]|uniref:Na+/H+ antiporter n=1 Tax=Knoellia terrae TaxID=3404797 RepID=UPI003B42B509
MTLALTLAAIAVTVILVARLCAPLGLPAPIALLLVGLVASVLPVVPDVSLDPDVVLLGLLPPLLYAAALGTSLVDIRANRRAILGLSVGLVLFTTFGVAIVAWWLLPIPFAVAVALGAIVAPPDAVAATAVARGIGLPRRVTTILEGESLLNDATALVTLRTAIAAAGLASTHHGFASHGAVSVGSVARDFGLAVVGGVGVGWVVFVLIGLIRRQLTEASSDTALSFAAPFLSYLPAELLGASGVLAVVTTGLLLAHKAPVLQSASSRLSERINWASVTFLLENAVFLLIGLQLSRLLTDVEASEISVGRAALVGLAILVTVLALRPLWLFPFTWLVGRLGRSSSTSADVPGTAVTSWAGMRGVVTLAAALTLPEDTDQRPTLVLIALIVTVGTLALQSTTLPVLARALDVRGPDPREDALQEATVVQATTGAGLRALEAEAALDPVVAQELRTNAELRVNRIWERLGTLGPRDDETPSEARRRLRIVMLEAERRELMRIRDEDDVDHEILSGVLSQLDAEEAALSWSTARAARIRDSDVLAPEQVSRACEHLAREADCAVPSSAGGCEQCLREGLAWVHLRICTRCGQVGCCDSSPGQHASKHFREEQHPVMRSLEPGEAWRWCFVDEVLG